MTASKTTEEIRDLYDGIASWWRWMSIPDALIGITRARRSLFSRATGDVLDVACGTGENFPHLGSADSLTAVDLSPAMVAQARQRAEKLGLDVRISEADAAVLPFADESFDIVVSALSTCTFTDPIAAFGEMERVTRAGGQILLLEHGRSSVEWIARRQDRNLERHLEHTGCRYNRDPVAEVEEAGLRIVEHHRSHLGMGHRFVVAVD
jgi:ubiquinone/menaquinone biosynthesis C-methylase UbiE